VPQEGEVRTRVLDATGLGLHLGQKPTAKAVVAIARVARDLPADALPAFEAWIDLSGWNPDEHGSEATLEQFRAEYQGSHLLPGGVGEGATAAFRSARFGAG
jgi:hypothetical protein